VKNFGKLSEAIAFSSGRDAAGHPKVTLTVEHDGKRQDVDILPALVETNKRSGDAIREIGLLPAQEMIVDDVQNHSPALRLHQGDKVMAVNGQKIFSFQQLNEIIDQAGDRPLAFSIEREGKMVEMPIQPVLLPLTTPLATITVPNAVPDAKKGEETATLDIVPVYAGDEKGDHASPATPAQTLLVWNVENRGGVFGQLHAGDFLRKVNGQPVGSVQQVVDALKATPAGQSAVLAYDRPDAQANASLSLPGGFVAAVTPPGSIARIGAMFRQQTTILYTSPVEQFASAFGQIFGMLRSLFNPHSDIGIGQLAGPIGISRIIYEFSIEDIRLALWFVFIINVNLAIINLLPIPLLDGGHILFYTIERIRRRALPVNVIATAQAVCLVLLLGLAAFVFFNDSRRWVGDNERDSAALRYRVYFLHEEDLKYPAAPASPAAGNP
jgi:membrane-associated protease RseP (regulator of RpoE activity)